MILPRKMNKIQLTRYLFHSNRVPFKGNICKVILSPYCVYENYQYQSWQMTQLPVKKVFKKLFLFSPL